MALEKALAEVTDLFRDLKKRKEIRAFALIGGLAVSAWANPRATRDIDFSLLIDPPRDRPFHAHLKTIAAFFQKNRYRANLKVGGLDDPIPYLLKLVKNDERVDILVAVSPLEKEAVLTAKSIKILGKTVPVISPEHLIIMKLLAGGPQDLMDARELFTRSRVSRSQVIRLARQARVVQVLQKVLDL